MTQTRRSEYLVKSALAMGAGLLIGGAAAGSAWLWLSLHRPTIVAEAAPTPQSKPLWPPEPVPQAVPRPTDAKPDAIDQVGPLGGGFVDCSSPPYGGSAVEYKAFVKDFGELVVPTRFLHIVCALKYEHGDRTPLYNLGFTDAEIDSADTEELGVATISATSRTLHKSCQGRSNCF